MSQYDVNNNYGNQRIIIHILKDLVLFLNIQTYPHYVSFYVYKLHANVVCQKNSSQIAKFSRPDSPLMSQRSKKTLSAKTFPVAVCVKLKMNVLVEIVSQKAKICQTAPT